jgi:DNA replication protein
MTIKHLLAWLQEGNISIPSFLLEHYAKMGLTEQEMMLLIHLHHFQKKGNDFPTPDEISEVMTLSSLDCLNLLRKLIQKGYIEIIEEMSENSILTEKYSLLPMQEKMVTHFLALQKASEAKSIKKEEESLYSIFEKEFGRPLSPFECETLGMWMDEHDNPALIKSALREAVISGKLNFRYIDRILFEWKKNGIKTEAQAKEYAQKFRAYQKRERKWMEQTEQKEFPFYNWLEN